MREEEGREAGPRVGESEKGQVGGGVVEEDV